jgi:regulator of RNase E activity RraA
MTAAMSTLAPATAATVTTLLLKIHGLRNTAVRGLRANDAAACRFAGPAVTLRYLPVRDDMLASQSLANPEALMHRVLDRLGPGDVLVIDGMGREDAGILGDVICARLKVLGVAGVVCDGAMRDVVEIARLGLPMFCRGATPPPSFVQLMLQDLDVPIACGGVTVFPGDAVIADEDGVAICPAHLAEAILPAAAEQDRIERYIRERVLKGERLKGLYPPNPATNAAYRAWIEAGEPG